jgi:hypothetical protein
LFEPGSIEEEQKGSKAKVSTFKERSRDNKEAHRRTKKNGRGLRFDFLNLTNLYSKTVRILRTVGGSNAFCSYREVVGNQSDENSSPASDSDFRRGSFWGERGVKEIAHGCGVRGKGLVTVSYLSAASATASKFEFHLKRQIDYV